MSTLNILEKNILESKDFVIAHQCNCVTTYGKGLSKTIFENYPVANDYSRRKNGYTDKRGTIRLHKVSENRYIANLFAQYKPGKPDNKETEEQRLQWFSDCLYRLGKWLCNYPVENRTVGMPYKIGCGLAGGDWKEYRKLLEKFCAKFQVRLTLYKI